MRIDVSFSGSDAGFLRDVFSAPLGSRLSAEFVRLGYGVRDLVVTIPPELFVEDFSGRASLDTQRTTIDPSAVRADIRTAIVRATGNEAYAVSVTSSGEGPVTAAPPGPTASITDGLRRLIETVPNVSNVILIGGTVLVLVFAWQIAKKGTLRGVV